MSKIIFDYETKSSVDLTKCGKVKYLADPQADIVCCAWKIEQENTKIWTPRMELPQIFREPTLHTWFAFNGEFDRYVTNVVGKRYGMSHLPLDNLVDTMGVCGKFSYPQGLDKAGDALNLDTRKDRRGKALMKKICIPPFEYTQAELKAFYVYCIRDVDTLAELIAALPSDTLDKNERAYWETTMRLNARGIPVDHLAVTRILDVINFYLARETRKLPLITDGEVQTAKQRDAILRWMKGFDIELPNLQAQTVEDTLKMQLPEPVRKVLELRQLLGGAAIAKYKALNNRVVEGRVHDNICYCGALHTGRDSGMGFQLQNLPRASVPDPQEFIDKFYDTSILQDDDPLGKAKALIRPMIRARKGYILLGADYSSIEYVLLIWFCGETVKLQDFAAGVDPYKTFAVSLTGIPYADITKDIRQDAKPGILGGGYCLSGKSLVEYAKNMGVDIGGVHRSKEVITLYRADHSKVVDTWEALTTASVNAVEYPGELFPVHSAEFQAVRDRTGKSWLLLKLPSGRYLYYCEPVIGESYGRKVVQHMGVNSYTKKWQSHILRASVLINNVIQGAAADIIRLAAVALEQQGYHSIFRVHDEIVCEEKINSMQTLENMIEIMVDRPSWCLDLPLKADGFVGERYRK